MTLLNPYAYDKHIKGVADLISEHVSIPELNAIIQDYCAIPSPNKVMQGACLNCHKSHRRKYSMLCMTCKSLCLLCGLSGLAEHVLFCFGCAGKFPSLANSHNGREKYRVFMDWHSIEFPSVQYLKGIESKRKKEIALAEEKRKELAFLAAEDAKPKDQQIQELRAKLYEANKQIDQLMSHHYIAHQPRPKYPYF